MTIAIKFTQPYSFNWHSYRYIRRFKICFHRPFVNVEQSHMVLKTFQRNCFLTNGKVLNGKKLRRVSFCLLREICSVVTAWPKPELWIALSTSWLKADIFVMATACTSSRSPSSWSGDITFDKGSCLISLLFSVCDLLKPIRCKSDLRNCNTNECRSQYVSATDHPKKVYFLLESLERSI